MPVTCVWAVSPRRVNPTLYAASSSAASSNLRRSARRTSTQRLRWHAARYDRQKPGVQLLCCSHTLTSFTLCTVDRDRQPTVWLPTAVTRARARPHWPSVTVLVGRVSRALRGGAAERGTSYSAIVMVLQRASSAGRRRLTASRSPSAHLRCLMFDDSNP